MNENETYGMELKNVEREIYSCDPRLKKRKMSDQSSKLPLWNSR